MSWLTNASLGFSLGSYHFPMRTAIAIFCKHPQPGSVKTRLAKSTSPEWAALVAEAMLLDTMHHVQAIADVRYLLYTPPAATEYFSRLAADQFRLRPQVEGDLGRKLDSAFQGLVGIECDALVAIGTDSPTLPSEYIEQALRRLESADVVLGPAMDGGYYLIGCARKAPSVFTGISWGGEYVLTQTIARLTEAHARLALLPPWYDVDTLEDWQFLRSHLSALEYAGSTGVAPNTRALKTFIPTV